MLGVYPGIMLGVCTRASCWVCVPGYSMVGIHLSYHGGYTPLPTIPPTHHPGYTHHPPAHSAVRASSPAHNEVRRERPPGSVWEKPMGGSLSGWLSPLRCDERRVSLRKVTPLLPHERTGRLDAHRVTLGISRYGRHLCAEWVPVLSSDRCCEECRPSAHC